MDEELKRFLGEYINVTPSTDKPIIHNAKQSNQADLEQRFAELEAEIKETDRLNYVVGEIKNPFGVMLPVGKGGSKLSDRTMLSEKYACCVGVVMSKGPYMFLTHHDAGGMELREKILSVGFLSEELKERAETIPSLPANYLQEGLDGLFSRCGNDNLSDVMTFVTGGDPKHTLKVIRHLISKNVQINAWYLDGIQEYGGSQESEYKKLIVSPSTKEVLLYSQKLGFTKLN